MQMRKTAGHDRGEFRVKGTIICPGIGIGRAHVLDAEVHVRHSGIRAADVPAEQARYRKAVESVQSHLQDHVAALHEETPEHAAVIMEVHRAILGDDSFHAGVRARIEQQLHNAEWALEEEGERLMAQFESMRDAFFQARREDVRDMVMSVLRALAGNGAVPQVPDWEGQEDTAVATWHLHPSSAMQAQRVGAEGFATESRAVFSHAAILLKGFGMPAVGNCRGLMSELCEGDRIIVDGTAGEVIVRPSEETLGRCRASKAREISVEAVAPIRSHTADGNRVRLLGNMENPEQARLVKQKGLEGVGLFRTEFFVLATGKFPDEEEQFDIYRRVSQVLDGRELTVRTFDIGADKQVPGLQVCTGMNPALGLRGLRRHLERDAEEFRAQIRAILRAGEFGRVGILLPMVTTVSDLCRARQHVDAARRGLEEEGHSPPPARLGAMIETPAAAVGIRDLLAEVDFVSLGTNDLLQYFMAADRDNEDVLQYNDPRDRSFVWLLDFIIRQAAEMGREEDVAICGEIASRPDMLPLLLRLGYRTFSVSPVMADDLRAAIGRTRVGDER